MSIIIYHNPRCSKSRQTLALIEEQGVTPEVKLYLDEPMDASVLTAALNTFGEKMIRTGEADYKENIKPLNLEGDALVEALLKFPKTIERPLVINGEKQALGRPPESVLEIL